MKKHLFFVGIVVTLLVILFTFDEAESFSDQHPVVKKKERWSVVLVTSLSGPRSPLNNSGDKNSTYFKATPSFSSQTSSHLIRLHQAFYFFKTLFRAQDVEEYRLVEPSFFHSFLLTLFGAIASPNAP